MRNLVSTLLPTLCLVAALGCSDARVSLSGAKATGNRIGYLRGFRAIDQVVKARLVDADPSGYWDVGSLLEGRSFSADLTGFRILLGGFGPASAHAEFQNGAPNAVNMLLWELILGRLADTLAKNACGSGIPDAFVTVRAEALEVLKPLCAGPQTPVALQSLWFLVMGFESPPEELDTWAEAFAGKQLPPKDLLRSLFLNPYFLLEN